MPKAYKPELMWNYSPVIRPMPVPGGDGGGAPITSAMSAPTVCVEFSAVLIPYLIGLLEVYRWPTAFEGTPDQVRTALGIIQDLIVILTEAKNCMPDSNCCPETNALLSQMLTVLQGLGDKLTEGNGIAIQNRILINNQNNMANFQYHEGLRGLDDGVDPKSFAPDAPLNWDTDPSDTTPAAQTARSNTLCAAVAAYVGSAASDMVSNYQKEIAGTILVGAVITAISSILGPGGTMVGIFLTTAVVAISQAEMASLSNSQALQDVICCMIKNLKGSVVSFDSFKSSINNCDFTPNADSDNVATIIRRYNQEVQNYRAFVAQLERYRDGASSESNNCACETCGAATVFDRAVDGPDGAWVRTRVRNASITYNPETFEYTITPGAYRAVRDGIETWYFHDMTVRTNGCCDILSLTNTPPRDQWGWERVDCNNVRTSGAGGLQPGDNGLKEFWFQMRESTPDTLSAPFVTKIILEKHT